MIEIYAVGGYNEVGKNCTAINVDGEVIIIDLGIHLENYIKLTEDEDIIKISADKLIDVGAVPNISVLDKIKDNVKAIVIGHAHLDHLGAAPYVADKFNAPIICSPYTAEVLKSILKEDRIKMSNEIKPLNLNSFYKLTDNLKIELIHITHSVPQAALVAIHTKYGIILYANDFKLDLHPTLGKKPDFNRLEEIGNKGVIALIVESTYANDARKMPSEKVAKEMLKDVLLGVNNKDNLIIVTTFSSHIARLKSIIEFGKKLNRKIVFLGRSLAKYVKAAENIGIVNFSKDVEIVKYSGQIERRLKKIDKDRKKYLLAVTGHQGEPKSVLARMIFNNYFNFKKEDIVIFSCTIIPGEENIKNREKMENELKKKRVRIFRDIHVSGHGAREDARDLINMINPKNLIPTHSEIATTEQFLELAEELGYRENKNVFLLRNGAKINIK